jgi:hypothetical protein
MSRSCARPGCARAAVATLSYAYADGIVVLEPLANEAHPMVHDLCRTHADGLRVPRGWELEDRRGDEELDVRSTPAAGSSGAVEQLDLIGA